MTITGIYKIQSYSKPNKIYIGSSINIKARILQHLSDLRRNIHNSIKLQNHYNKYGEHDLQFTILLCCEKEDLIKIEQYFIDSYSPFFNCSPTAGNCLGVKHSPETRKKLSKIRTGMSNGFYGKCHSEETKKKISQSRMGKGIHTDEWKKQQSARMSGKNHPLYGIKITGDRLRLMSEVKKGKKASKVTREKMSKSGKIAWQKRKQLNK